MKKMYHLKKLLPILVLLLFSSIGNSQCIDWTRTSIANNGVGNLTNGIYVLTPVTASRTSTVSALSFNLTTNGATETVRMAIYSGFSSPTDLLGYTNVVSLNTLSQGIRQINLVTPVNVTAGTKYWIGANLSANANVFSSALQSQTLYYYSIANTAIPTSSITPISFPATITSDYGIVYPSTSTPTASSPQNICAGTVNDLVATGTALNWYNTATGGTALATTTALATGNYYVTQTLNGCESARVLVSVNIGSIPAPGFFSAETVSGFNQDIVVDGNQTSSVSPVTSATATVDVGSSYFMAPNFTLAGVATTASLPVNGTFTSQTTSNLPFKLAPYNTNNSLKVNKGITATLNLDETKKASSMYVLATSGDGAAKANFTIVFSDNSTQVFNNIDVNDWYDGLNAAISGIGRFSGGAIQTPSNNPRLYQIKLDLSFVNQSKTIKSLIVQNITPVNGNQDNSIIQVMGITLSTVKTYCTGATVADLLINGSNIKWYSAATGGAALATTTALVNGNTYYASQTINGCESARTSVAVTINAIPAAPTATAQTFCNGATVANLVGNGVSGATFNWYNVANGGTPLTTTTTLATGTYYVTQTTNSCESARTSVVVTVNTTAAPTASAQTFCGSAIVTNLVATGTAPKWYTVATGGTALTTASALTTGTYYVTQTINGCESARTSVVVTVNTTAAPTASAQTFCGSATVTNLVATGTALKWYDVATNGTALASTANLTTGTYYVTQTTNGCESTRTSVAVTVNTTAAPTASAQTFCGTSTVANLVTTGTAPKWYAVATGGTALVNTTALATGTYYVTQTLNNCESTRTSVAVTVNAIPNAPMATSPQSLSTGNTIANLVASGTNLKWYAASTGGTALATSTTLVNGTSYYVSQTVGTCESLRTVVVVNLTNFVVTPATATVCSGVTTTLTTSGALLPLTNTGKIGVNNNLDSSENFFNSAWGNVKSQSLYTAAELTSLGLVAGSSINSIGFVMTATTTAVTYNNFNLFAGLVAQQSITDTTTFISGANTTVFSSASYTPAIAGGNIDYPLAFPIIWDGTSSLLIQGCFSNNNNGTGSGTGRQLESTLFASPNVRSITGLKDNTFDACAANLSSFTAKIPTEKRPNIRMSFSSPSTITWSPITGLFTDAAATTPYVANANAATIYAKPTATNTYTASSTNGTTTLTATSVITVNPLPTAAQLAITRVGDVFTVAQSGAVYQWYKIVGGLSQIISGATNQSYTATATGFYYAEVTINGCLAETDFVTITTLGTNNFEFNTKLNIYPNPSNAIFNIDIDANATFEIHDLVGKQIQTGKINLGTSPLDLTNYNSGIYLLKVTNELNQTKTIKLIKQ